MSREILFRGKVTEVPKYLKDRMKIGDWVYGSHVDYPVAQIFDLEDEYIVDPATVGRFTGLNELAGEKKKIFEGDIYLDFLGKRHVIIYSDNMACFTSVLESDYTMGYPLHFESKSQLQVIGNIHDTQNNGKKECSEKEEE